MIKATLDKQLMITVDNKVGTLAEIVDLISSAGVNMIAICAYAINSQGFINFVTEDNKKAKKILESKNYNIREEEIVLASLSNKPGTLQTLCENISGAGIDLNLIYGSVEKDQKTSRIILVSEDNPGVISIIRAMS